MEESASLLPRSIRTRSAEELLSMLGVATRALLATLVVTGAAVAGFTSVINVPPDPAPHGVLSDTQVNLYDGGVLPDDFSVGDQHFDLNIYGGTVGNFARVGSWETPVQNSGVTVNLSGGSIGFFFETGFGVTVNVSGESIGREFEAGPTLNQIILAEENRYTIDRSAPGTVVNVSGGYIGDSFNLGLNSTLNLSGGLIDSDLILNSGNTVNISGGTINSWISASSGATVNVSGGATGPLSTGPGSHLTISGNDFRLNGAPIGGLAGVGSTLAFNVPQNAVLSGTLADGTPFAIPNGRWGGISDSTLTLQTANVPAAPPISIQLPRDAMPGGLRSGQTLIVGAGAAVGSRFNAGVGSVVTIAGGTVGDGFQATGAIVNLSSGEIGSQANALIGSVFNISGGVVQGNFFAGSGSSVNIAGGDIRSQLEAANGSVVNVSGGTFENDVTAHAGSRFTISGGEFRVNGTPMSGLSTVGSSRQFDIPANSVLSGVFPDGRPFAFSDQDFDQFDAGTLTLQAAALPPRGAAVVHLPSDPMPVGPRTGQTLIVDDGGHIGDHFSAAWGSAVTINGGDVGIEFKAIGSLINITGGTVRPGFETLYGTMVNITGGEIGSMDAKRGSVVSISGGCFDNWIDVDSGGVVNMSAATRDSVAQ